MNVCVFKNFITYVILFLNRNLQIIKFFTSLYFYLGSPLLCAVKDGQYVCDSSSSSSSSKNCKNIKPQSGTKHSSLIKKVCSVVIRSGIQNECLSTYK